MVQGLGIFIGKFEQQIRTTPPFPNSSIPVICIFSLMCNILYLRIWYLLLIRSGWFLKAVFAIDGGSVVVFSILVFQNLDDAPPNTLIPVA